MPRFESNITINATPTAPSHAARLEDVEKAVSVHFKANVRAAAVQNIAGTYDALVLTGAQWDTLPPVDGLTLALGDRVLLTAQTDSTQNGIYEVTGLGDGASEEWTLTRAADFDSSSDISPNVQVKVTQGADSADKIFILTTDGPITLDAVPLDFTVYTGLTKVIRETVFVITGDGANYTAAHTHSWGTRNVTAEIIDEDTWQTVCADVERTTVNTVTVTFGRPVPNGKVYRVILRAELQPV
jgi:hypothetical protein